MPAEAVPRTGASAPLSVNLASVAEGSHQLQPVAVDLVDNISSSTPWTVLVDRSGPPPPN